jgi:penicillin amidase
MPLLANDPHRALAHPSLRYLIHLHAPGWNVAGAASPWLPGVAIGHNDRVAWGVASFPADTQDVFVERVNPMNAHQVQTRGRFVDTVVVKDPIVIKGRAKAFDFEREYTPHGVVIASDRERHLAFTLRWTGMEAGAAGELAALGIDRSRTVDDLLEALKAWRTPPIEIVYADAAGRIGRQAAGLVPVRSSPDGAVPVPGWTGAFEWVGFRSLAAARDVTAKSPFEIAANRNVPRTNRLRDVLSAGTASTIDAFKVLQHDTTSWNAQRLVPLLAQVRSERLDVDEARRRLVEWDRRVAADSSPATLYVYWEEALLRKLAERRVPTPLRDGYVVRTPLDVSWLTNPTRTWFDGDLARERDSLLLEALTSAVDRVNAQPAMSWGRLNAVTFKHPLSVNAAARRLFDIGPFERGGYAQTVMATYSRPAADVGASFSEILDVANWDRSAVANAPGQSGAPRSAHFSDLAKMWAAGEYFPLVFSDAAVQANMESTLTLEPPH